MLFTYMSVWINVGFTVKKIIQVCACREAKYFHLCDPRNTFILLH